MKKITDPIKTNNGYLILKINDRRKITETVQLDKELKKLVELETEKELNKFGYIYFNKLKKGHLLVKIKKPVIIVLGEPNSIFIEILSKF